MDSLVDPADDSLNVLAWDLVVGDASLLVKIAELLELSDDPREVFHLFGVALQPL